MTRYRFGWILLTVGAITAFAGVTGFLLERREPAPVFEVVPTSTPTQGLQLVPASPELTAAVVEFFADFANAGLNSDIDFLTGRLHAGVLARYAETQCADYLGRVLSSDYDVEVIDVYEPVEWEWTTDANSLIVTEAITLTLLRPDGGEKVERTAHLELVEDELRWFTDCGRTELLS